MSIEYEDFTVTVIFTGKLPKDPDQRRELYGTTEPMACFAVDFENDSGAFFCDFLENPEIVSVTKEGKGG